MAFRDIRDAAGHLLLRYDPERRILQVKQPGRSGRNKQTTIDLRLYEGPRAPDIMAEVLAGASRSSRAVSADAEPTKP